MLASPLLASGERDLVTGFTDALSFQKTFLWRMLRLHISLNVRKAQWIPLLHALHLGFICSSPTLEFREAPKGAKKLHSRVSELRAAVKKSHQVPALLVVRLMGSLWSRKLIMHRAVAVECRALIDLLAVHIRLQLGPWRNTKKGSLRLMTILLKKAWKGFVA